MTISSIHENLPFNLSQKNRAKDAEKTLNSEPRIVKQLTNKKEIKQEETKPFKDKQTQLSLLTKQMESFLSHLNKEIGFRVDEDSGKIIATVYEVETGKIIRQFPEEKMLKIAQRLSDKVGTLINEKI